MAKNLVAIFLVPFLAISAHDNVPPQQQYSSTRPRIRFDCGGGRFASEPFIYRSESDDGREQHIYISRRPIGSGAFSKVFIGFTGPRQNKNLPPNQCVAVKLSKLRDDEGRRKMALKMQEHSKCMVDKIRNALPRGERSWCQFIVQIHDIGIVDEESVAGLLDQRSADEFRAELAQVQQAEVDDEVEKDEGDEEEKSSMTEAEEMDIEDQLLLGVTIMELGEETLAERMYHPDRTWTRHRMSDQIRRVVEPLRGLHTVAMHLDFKPANLVFISSRLKLIDFDGAEMVPTRQNLRPAGPSAGCRKPTFPIGTRTYASPEYFTCHLMSTKSDIWAVGMIIYEFLLGQPKLDLYRSELPPKKQANISRFLHNFGTIYRGFVVEKKTKSIRQLDQNMYWFSKYHVALEMLIHLWGEKPRIGLLLTALLASDPDRRPSADAILDFLDGNCRLELDRNPGDKTLMLFSGVSAWKLKELIQGRVVETDPKQNFFLRTVEDPTRLERFERKHAHYRRVLTRFMATMQLMEAEMLAMDGKRICGQADRHQRRLIDQSRPEMVIDRIAQSPGMVIGK